MSKKKAGKHDSEWAEAKRRCRLSAEDVRKAKELGFKPRSLIKNIPAKSQPWKAPVRDWIRELYAKRFGHARATEFDRKGAAPSRPSAETAADPFAQEDLLPQYDTVNEEPYFVREADGRDFSLEEAGQYFFDPDAELNPDNEDGWPGLEDVDLDRDSEPSQREIESEDRLMLRRQRQFRTAAEAVAKAMGLLAEVEKVALFGSVAGPLEKEVPRFREFRRARIAIRHECRDVDLAVWVSSLGRLRALQKARGGAINDLLADHIGVAHHQVDVFLIEPGTDRYLGRLCCFGQCPKDKRECRAAGCGATPFLQQHENFTFDWPSASDGSVVLYEKGNPH